MKISAGFSTGKGDERHAGFYSSKAEGLDRADKGRMAGVSRNVMGADMGLAHKSYYVNNTKCYAQHYKSCGKACGNVPLIL
jgi:hypothetical protein